MSEINIENVSIGKPDGSWFSDVLFFIRGKEKEI